MSLPGAISSVPGQPCSIRIGTVTDTSPLRVNVQGVEFTNLGYIAPLPALGDTVALIGQSTSVTTDPTSWLVLGAVLSGE